MMFKLLLFLSLYATCSVVGSPLATPQVREAAIAGPDKDGKYTLEAEGIRASFIPYGASITNLWVKDKNGVERDVVLGYDTAEDYEKEPHLHMGGVPGRYANRIGNSTFKIDGTEYKVLPNEGPNQLHGGPNGWDYRKFNVTSLTRSSITFSIFDPDGSQGFPGDVVSHVTYTLSPYTWTIRINALSLTKKTPIMLTSHAYWNLDGFSNKADQTILNHKLSMPFARERVEVDGALIPTGKILKNKPGSLNDFWTRPKAVGKHIDTPEAVDNCGKGCVGYDNCWINRKRHHAKPVTTVSSPFSGIELKIYTNQDAFQIFSCNFPMEKNLPLKKTQGAEGMTEDERYVAQYGCLVLEVQDWIDGINNPEWGRLDEQVFGPESGGYELTGKFVFGVTRERK